MCIKALRLVSIVILSSLVACNTTIENPIPIAVTPPEEKTPIPTTQEIATLTSPAPTPTFTIQPSPTTQALIINPLDILLTPEEAKIIDQELFSSLYMDGLEPIIYRYEPHTSRNLGLRNLSGILEQTVYFATNREYVYSIAAENESQLIELESKTIKLAEDFQQPLEDFYTRLNLAELSDNLNIISGDGYTAYGFGFGEVYLTFFSGATLIELKMTFDGTNEYDEEKVDDLIAIAEAIDAKRNLNFPFFHPFLETDFIKLDNAYFSWVRCYDESRHSTDDEAVLNDDQIIEFLPDLEDLNSQFPNLFSEQLPNQNGSAEKQFRIGDSSSFLNVEMGTGSFNLSSMDFIYPIDISTYWPAVDSLLDRGVANETSSYEEGLLFKNLTFVQGPYAVEVVIEMLEDDPLSDYQVGEILGFVGTTISERLAEAGIQGVNSPITSISCDFPPAEEE